MGLILVLSPGIHFGHAGAARLELLQRQLSSVFITGSHTGGPCLFRNRELEMKSLFGAISPNRESSEHADEQIREKRERVITPASGNVFDSESFDGQPDAGDPVSPNAPTLHATSSPPAYE